MQIAHISSCGAPIWRRENVMSRGFVLLQNGRMLQQVANVHDDKILSV